MKKLGIGCLVALVLLGGLGLVAAYLIYDRVYKPASEYVGSFKELGAIAELERGVKNTAPFAEPTSGELNEELVERSQEIAIAHGISVYDAGYVAAAERVGAVLVSCDEADLVGVGLARLPAAVLG